MAKYNYIFIFLLSSIFQTKKAWKNYVKEGITISTWNNSENQSLLKPAKPYEKAENYSYKQIVLHCIYIISMNVLNRIQFIIVCM